MWIRGPFVAIIGMTLAACGRTSAYDTPVAQSGMVSGICYRVDGDAMPTSQNLTYTPLQTGLELVPVGLTGSVKVVHTDANGRFQFQWQPGSYYLRGTDYGSYFGRQEFVIREGETTEVRVEIAGHIVY